MRALFVLLVLFVNTIWMGLIVILASALRVRRAK
jgi:hypothetical protein